jgi:transposase-like protein
MKAQAQVVFVVVALILAIAFISMTLIRRAGAEERQEFRDRNGQFQGTAITRNGRIEYRDRNGWFQGSKTTTVNKPRR